jgi:hypothetical protein
VAAVWWARQEQQIARDRASAGNNVTRRACSACTRQALRRLHNAARSRRPARQLHPASPAPPGSGAGLLPAALCAAIARSAQHRAAHGESRRTLTCLASRRHDLTCCLHVSSEYLPSSQSVAQNPLCTPSLARGWACPGGSSSPIRLTLANNDSPHRTAAAGPVTNSTMRRSKPLQNLPRSIRPVTKHRIMHLDAGAYLHDSSSIKALPPQASRCAVIHAAASTPAATARLQELPSCSSAAWHARVLQRHREHRA